MKKKKLILKIFEKIGLKRIKVNQKPNIRNLKEWLLILL